jgi:hypothetical protein
MSPGIMKGRVFVNDIKNWKKASEENKMKWTHRIVFDNFSDHYKKQ